MSSKTAYEDFLHTYIGDSGFYQVGVCSFILTILFFNQEFMSVNFVSAYTDFWCKVPTLANFSHEQQKYIAIPTDDNGEYSQCNRMDLDFDAMTEEDFYSWNR